MTRAGASRTNGRLGALATVVAGLLAGSSAFLCRVTAWPEIVTPAYFVASGLRLYDQVFFVHSPLLILATAAGGSLFGFDASLQRALAGLPLAAVMVLLVAGTRGPRPGRLRLAILLGLPLVVLHAVYFEGPVLYADPWTAVPLLAGALLLERFERRGDARALGAAGIALGAAILVKQTSAWAVVAACAWLVLRSRRRSVRALGVLAAGAAAPYAAFALLWGAGYQTLAHVRWTLLVPLQMALAGDNRTPADWNGLHEAIGPFLAFPALGLVARLLPAPLRFRSPLAWVALGSVGMTYPRWSLLAFSGSLGLVALAGVRIGLVLSAAARRRAKGLRLPRLLAGSVGAGLAATSLGVALLGAGPLLLDRLGGPVWYWDDDESRRFGEIASKRLRPGDEVVLFGVPWDTLYVRTGTRMPGKVYVNTYFWDHIDKLDVDALVVRRLEAAPGTLVLFRDVEDEDVRATGIYRFLSTRTSVVEELGGGVTWRVIAPQGAKDDAAGGPGTGPPRDREASATPGPARRRAPSHPGALAR